MSMSINVLMFDWKVLVDHLVDYGCDNRIAVEEVLHLYGEKICDKYVVLLCDYYEPDSFCMLCNAMESLFDVEDCFDHIYDLDFDYICNDATEYGAMEGIAKRLEQRISGD